MKKFIRKYILRTVAFLLGSWNIYKARLLGRDLLPQKANPEALARIYLHARKNIPYYQQHLPEIDTTTENVIASFQKLKFSLEKRVLKEDIFQVMDPRVVKRASVIDYKSGSRNNFFKLLGKDTLIPVNTGGSTGNPLRFFKTKESGVKMLLALLQIARFHGWEEGDKLLSVWQEGMYSQIGFLGKVTGLLGFSFFMFRKIDMGATDAFLQTLRKKKPAVLFSFPSYLTEFVTHLKTANRQIEFQPKFILCAGEMLFDHQRKFIEDFFNCKVYQFYGSMEMGFVAVECPGQHELHVLEEYAFLENNSEGNILTTPLDMYYMPLIKYNTGDRGTIVNRTCPCGTHGKTMIGVLEGRVEEYLLDKQGRKVYASYLRQLLLEMNEKFHNAILRAQFVQKKNGNVFFSIKLLSREYQNDLIGVIIQRLEKDLEVKTSGKVVEELFQEQGKFKFLIRE